MSFANLGLCPTLLNTLEREGYSQPTPIQQQAIPAILDGRDLLAAAQTGTGKTAAFTLPLLQKLDGTPPAQGRKLPRVLILAPTRELAAQVGESVANYGRGLSLTSTVIFGGVGQQPQVNALKRGVDILIATPGRLLDLVQQKHAHLGAVETLVLDEADRMLDMGFIHDIKRLLRLLPHKRQNLLFSATFSKDIRKLAHGLLSQPQEINVAPNNAPAELVHHSAALLAKDKKRALLSHLIRSNNWQQVLVFTRTKHGANRLCQQLERDGITCAALHGNKSQSARTRALAGFKDGSIGVLVATDIAARGIDIEQLPQVVNYELPNIPADYVHRIGRTGRAGRTGQALSLVSPDERDYLRDIQRLLGQTLEVLPLDAYADILNAAQDAAAEAPERAAARPRNHQGNRQGNRQASHPRAAGGATNRPARNRSGAKSRSGPRSSAGGNGQRPATGSNPPRRNKARRRPQPA